MSHVIPFAAPHQEAAAVQSEPAAPARLSVAVIVASLGRADLINRMIQRMAAQTRQPDLLLFSTIVPADLPEDFTANDHVQAVFGPKGLPAQRNTALDHIGDRYDLVVFYDDDFVPSLHSIENVETFFRTNPDVAGATGHVLADGIKTAGIGDEEAVRIVAQHDRAQVYSGKIMRTVAGLYGCNMAYRVAAIGAVRFDERLRLYGWQEDIDFSAQLRSCGQIVATDAFAGVHQGVKHGRTSGLRLGYSQVINPLYLVRKGTMTPRYALRLMLGNVLMNHARMLMPEPWVDRMGRARGNWIGLFDALRGRLTPERIETL